MNLIAGSASTERILQLLEEDMSGAAFQAAMQELDASPALFESLVAAQFVKDALRGNCCPNRHGTAATMRFIAAAEAGRAAGCRTKKIS